MLKDLFKKIVLFFLERLAHWRLRKIKPEIIGVTGSVGKTSTKEALYQLLATHSSVHRNLKSLNTEFGALLTVLQQPSGYSSAGEWLKILWNGFWETLTLRKPPYKTLILEMGADKPGDIDYLVKHFRPSIGILTNVKSVHMAEGQFPSIEAILKEKSKLIQSLPKNGTAILNEDDERVASLKDHVNCEVLLFGTSSRSDLRAEQVKNTPKGLHMTVHYQKQSQAFHFPNLLGEHHIYVMLPAIAIGMIKGFPLKEMTKILEDFKLPPGRMNRLEGIHHSTIVDSSYNASPDTMDAALDVLKGMPGRRIAALGSMNELGSLSKKAHLTVGEKVATCADLLITVGKEAEYYGAAAQQSGMKPNQIQEFDSSQEAGEFLKKIIQRDDVILAKGSQNNVRMEYLVQCVMRYPEKAKTLLVRQDDYWLSQK